MRYKAFLSHTKERLKPLVRRLFFKEIYVDGKEPPKSYAFNIKFIGIYIIFLVYSLMLLIALNFPEFPLLDIITFYNPFAFSNALVTLFLLLSILYSNDRFRNFIFGDHSAIKQLILYVGAVSGFFLLFSLTFTTTINFMSYLLALSTIWLILYSTRFYMYSRKFATKIESRFIAEYSTTRRVIANISPYLILCILVTIALFYRSLLVFISLDFFGPFAPEEAVIVYNVEMRLIMPLIYFSLVLTLLFILFEFIFTRRRAETKRAGLFDNYTFSLIVLFIFFFQIFQISIYLILRPETIDALKTSVGASSSTVSFILLFEYEISMFFLYRIIMKLGRSLGWQISIFKRDGLVILILGCVFAQTLSRYALQTQVTNQEITLIGNILMSDKYIVSIIMIIFLGVTLLIYYLKPHETSMFIRLQKETINQKEESMEIIYKLLKSEYIRRGAAYPIEILEREMIRATKLSKSAIYSLIAQLAKSDMDFHVTTVKNDYGITRKIIDFVSVTEKFDKKEIAQLKAKKYLSERLYSTMKKSKKKYLKLGDNLSKEKASDQFLTSLTMGYEKKQKEEVLIEEKKRDTEIRFLKKEVPESLREKIIQMLKKEYSYRIENVEKYANFHYAISEIASQIQLETRITPGELYPILESINETEIELVLLENPDEPEDKMISFLPVADDDLMYTLANFRPDDYNQIRIYLIQNFIKFLKRKKSKAVFNKLKKGISKKTEVQRIWKDLINILINYYPLYTQVKEKVQEGKDLLKLFNQFPKKEIIEEN